MVSGQTPLLRSGESVHLRLRRHRDLWLDQLQYEVSQPKGFQILLGSAGAQVERQNYLTRYSRGRARLGECAAVLLFARCRSVVHKKTLRRDGRNAVSRLSPGGRLARRRQGGDLL